jgi:hypothetical protein
VTQSELQGRVTLAEERSARLEWTWTEAEDRMQREARALRDEVAHLHAQLEEERAAAAEREGAAR